MLKEKIAKAKTELEELRSVYSTDLTKATEFAENGKIEEARSLKTGLTDKQKGIADKEDELRDLTDLQAQLNQEIASQEKRGAKKVAGNNSEERDAINNYIHSRGTVRDGLTSTDVDVTIPESIIYNPQAEVNSVTDLSKLVQQFSATTASGKYPIVKRATAKLASVAELTKNPELAKPDFEEVNWEVATYRGAIPISNESIQDSAIDLVSLVAQNAMEQKINTVNDAISTVLKGFTAKTVAGESVDDIKHIINVDLDVAYNKTIVASQSFYQFLDTLKDKNGQYLLQQPIIDGSPARLLGIPVVVVEDTLLGLAGEAHAWIGDLNRAVLFANRLDIQVRWVDDNVFGQFLQAAIRFGVSKADSAAGYFVTYTAPVTAPEASK